MALSKGPALLGWVQKGDGLALKYQVHDRMCACRFAASTRGVDVVSLSLVSGVARGNRQIKMVRRRSFWLGAWAEATGDHSQHENIRKTLTLFCLKRKRMANLPPIS